MKSYTSLEMPTDTTLADLPEPVSTRATELHNAGYPESEALGLALTQANCREDLTEEIATQWGVKPETLATYASKAESRQMNALRQFILAYGGNRTILAEQARHGRTEHRFIVSEFRNGEDYSDALEGDAHLRVFTVRGGGPSGEPAGNLSITETDAYDSLAALADDKYRQTEVSGLEFLTEWYELLTEAGIDPDTLEKPAEKLPDSHPDSANHHQYQMRSLERNSRR